MNIIIIDDGVNEKFAHIENLVFNLEITESLEIVERTDYNNAECSHGSICAAIIKRYNKDCKIGSIKILDTVRHNGSLDQFLKSLEWCLNLAPSLINMSFGTIDFKDYDPIRLLISKLISKNFIIVAACHTRCFSIPACLSEVISVKTDINLCDDNYYFNQNYFDNADIIASSRHEIQGAHSSFFPKISNSYSAPLITSKIDKILRNGGGYNVLDVKMELNHFMKSRKRNNLNFTSRPDFLDRAIIIYDKTKPLLNTDFFQFNVDCEVDGSEVLDVVLTERKSIIIIPNERLEDGQFFNNVYEFLNRNIGFIRGIVYAGIISKEMECKYLNKLNCLIWYENIFQRIHSNNINLKSDCSVPIISITGENYSVINAAVLLKREFFNNNYNVIVISDMKFSYLCGIEYIQNNLYDKNLFTYFEKYFNLDAIIVASNSFVNYDFLVELTCIYMFKENTIKIGYESIYNNPSKVYKYIANYFDENDVFDHLN